MSSQIRLAIVAWIAAAGFSVMSCQSKTDYSHRNDRVGSIPENRTDDQPGIEGEASEDLPSQQPGRPDPRADRREHDDPAIFKDQRGS